LRSDGIVEVLLKENITISVAMLREQVDVFKAMGDNKKYPMVFVAGKFTVIESDARTFSASADYNKYSTASAYVLNSLAQKLLGNVYFKIDKPIVPSKIFNVEEEATNWLYQFVDK